MTISKIVVRLVVNEHNVFKRPALHPLHYGYTNITVPDILCKLIQYWPTIFLSSCHHLSILHPCEWPMKLYKVMHWQTDLALRFLTCMPQKILKIHRSYSMHSLSDIATILNECQRPGNLRKHGRKIKTQKNRTTRSCAISILITCTSAVLAAASVLTLWQLQISRLFFFLSINKIMIIIKR